MRKIGQREQKEGQDNLLIFTHTTHKSLHCWPPHNPIYVKDTPSLCVRACLHLTGL